MSTDEECVQRAMKRFGMTRERLQAHYRRNAESLRTMARRADITGKPVNHYTASDLWARAARYERLGSITPEEPT